MATFDFRPSQTASSLTMIATATKVGATVIDSNLLNNKQVVPVSFTPRPVVAGSAFRSRMNRVAGTLQGD